MVGTGRRAVHATTGPPSHAPRPLVLSYSWAVAESVASRFNEAAMARPWNRWSASSRHPSLSVTWPPQCPGLFARPYGFPMIEIRRRSSQLFGILKKVNPFHIAPSPLRCLKITACCGRQVLGFSALPTETHATFHHPCTVSILRTRVCEQTIWAPKAP